MKAPAHVAPWKKDEVTYIVNLLQSYKVIGLVNMESLPSSQLQRMRNTLQGKAVIFMTKTRLLKLAFEQLTSKIKGIQDLEKAIQGMPALICTNDNPFTLAKILRKAKSKAPAKAGQKAPYDLVIPAGPTPFAPGPVIGELGQLGFKTQIQEGKIHIKEDKTVAKEGDVISGSLAGMLMRLSIEPMEIGINLTAVLEDGLVFLKKVLDVDEKVYIQQLQEAAAAAFNLACSVAYPTKENITILIQNAARDADALAESRQILTSTKAESMVSHASGTAQAFAEQLEGYIPNETTKHHPVEEVKKKPDIVNPAPGHPSSPPTPATNAAGTFKEEERVAQDVLKKLQDAKLKEAQKPRWAL